jgi:hypothetical protein
MKKMFRNFLMGVLALASVSCSETVEPDSATEVQSEVSLKSSTTSSFNMLCLNTAGLADWVTSEDGAANAEIISPLLNAYDIVCVQEDWQYHSELKAETTHPYLSNSSGTMGIGDGLNRFSIYDWNQFERFAWNDCNGYTDDGYDCWTPKGFSVCRTWLTDKICVDIYNLHADAGNTNADANAREDNFAQLLQKINNISEGNAVIVMGDMNCDFYEEDQVRILYEDGFSDSEIEYVYAGVYPEVDGSHNGSIDKIMYRSSLEVTLEAIYFERPIGVFIDENGDELSDNSGIHTAKYVEFQYTANDHKYVSLLTYDDTYVQAETGGGDAVTAEGDNLGGSEKFVMVPTDGGSTIVDGEGVYFRTRDGYYITADDSGDKLNATSKGMEQKQKFYVTNHTDSSGDLESGDVISLESVRYDGQYIIAKSDGRVKCSSTSIGNREKFTVTLH